VDFPATVSWVPPPALALGKFQLLEKVGEGAAGVIWRARDTELDRIVALKLPRSGQFEDSRDRDRFLRESRALARLHHSNIVAIHDVVHEADGLFIVEDYVDGVSLKEWLTTHRPTFRRAAELVYVVADALGHAHELGVIHRDVKPANVMLESVNPDDASAGVPHRQAAELPESSIASLRVRPRVMDFGLAKRDTDDVTITIDGQVLGTPVYMSPEQFRAPHAVDCRADIYSLGVLLYEMLTGELPFRGAPRMLLHQVLHDEPSPPRRLNDRIPRDLETICLKCLEKAPSGRYATARELQADLRRFLRGVAVTARPISIVVRAWRWYRRSPDSAISTAGGFTTAVALTLLIWHAVGVTMFLLGIHSTEKPLRVLLEFIILAVVYFIPQLFVGVMTINRSRTALWVGTFLSAASLITTVTMVAGASPILQLEVFSEARSSTYYRMHLSSLLMVIALLAFAAHVSAIYLCYAERRRDER
jgi:tRNA A-37 threonylcarbamoyl transferase component Bud32